MKGKYKIDGIGTEIKGVIFDLDGTLLDSMWVWERVDEEFLGRRGYDVPEDYQRKIAAMGFLETAEYTIERFGLKEKAEDVIREWNDMVQHIYHDEVCTKPFVREVLEGFRQQGLRLGVATASYASLFVDCLKRNEVYEYFHSFTETSEVLRGKGFPDIYIKAAEKLGCTPKECIVFEDLHQGIIAAREAGFYTIGVYEKKMAFSWADIERDADMAIHGFEEAMNLGQLLITGNN